MAGFRHLCSAAALAACPLSWLVLMSRLRQPQVSTIALLTVTCRLLQPLQLIFYGDDVTVEQYQGDCEHPGCAGGPAVFQKYFGEWRSAAFGIAGAQQPRAPGHAAAMPREHCTSRMM